MPRLRCHRFHFTLALRKAVGELGVRQKNMKLATLFIIFITLSVLVMNAEKPDARRSWEANQILAEASAIKPGQTRSALLKAFTTEGGISTPTGRKYVSIHCPYIKIDVTFKAVNPTRESRDDIILTISRPYLEAPIAD